MEKTLESRLQRAWGYLSEIKTLMNKIPMGNERVEVGTMLRNAMFVNGIMYNMEAWHNVSHAQFEKIKKVYNQMLRFITNAHSKTPLEFNFQEL